MVNATSAPPGPAEETEEGRAQSHGGVNTDLNTPERLTQYAEELKRVFSAIYHGRKPDGNGGHKHLLSAAGDEHIHATANGDVRISCKDENFSAFSYGALEAAKNAGMTSIKLLEGNTDEQNETLIKHAHKLGLKVVGVDNTAAHGARDSAASAGDNTQRTSSNPANPAGGFNAGASAGPAAQSTPDDIRRAVEENTRKNEADFQETLNNILGKVRQTHEQELKAAQEQVRTAQEQSQRQQNEMRTAHEQELAKIQQQFAALNDQYTALKEQSAQTAQQHADLRGQFGELQKNHAELGQQVQGLKKANEDLLGENMQLGEQYETMRGEHGEMGRKLSAATAAIEQKDKIIGGHEETIGNHEQVIAERDKTINGHLETIAGHEAKHSDREARLKSLHGQLDGLGLDEPSGANVPPIVAKDATASGKYGGPGGLPREPAPVTPVKGAAPISGAETTARPV